MRALLPVLLASSLLGCASVDSHETALGNYQDRGDYSYDNVHALSPALYNGQRGKLSVERLRSARLGNDALEVSMMLRNRTDYPLVVEARTLFLAKDGMPTEDESAWLRLFLEPKGVAGYREASMRGQDIQHFRVELRESD